MGDKFWSLFLFIQKSNLKTAFISKTDAAVNIFMMMLNNFSFIFMWWIIFNYRPAINGWNFQDMAFMFAIMNTGFGIYALCGYGVQMIPSYIENGSLDNFLLSPRNTLFMVASSYSAFANWGDILTGIIMYLFSGYFGWQGFILFLICTLCGTLLLFGFSLLLHSLAFRADNIERLLHNILLAFLTFTSQPASIFQGWYKIMFLTVIPAGFISLYPVSLVKNFSWTDLSVLLFATAFFLATGITLFYSGLRKYSSGNRFGLR